MLIEIDTSKIRESVNDLKQLSYSYFVKIDKTFNDLTTVTSSIGAWSGTSAIRFEMNANNDKQQYIRFKNTLDSYITKLNGIADEIENLCVEVKKQ